MSARAGSFKPKDMPCPNHKKGECDRPYDSNNVCRLFKCVTCGDLVPWCFGGDNDEDCDSCWAKKEEDE